MARTQPTEKKKFGNSARACVPSLGVQSSGTSSKDLTAQCICCEASVSVFEFICRQSTASSRFNGVS